MFEYNKRYWEREMGEGSHARQPDDGVKTYAAVGVAAGLALGGLVGWILGYPVPLASLGAPLGMWLGNHFRKPE